MKWFAGTLALLAIASGCVSLNKGSDRVALADAGKDAAEREMLASLPATLPAETMTAAARAGDRPRNGSHREAELAAELSVTALPPGLDLPGERTSTRVVRASPPETPRPPSPAPAPDPGVAETKVAEVPPGGNATLGAAGPSGVKLPTMINGAAASLPLPPPVQPALVEPPVARPTAAAVRMVNSKRISLNYEIKDVGPSGVSTVELWYTQDGKKWEKSDTPSKPRPPFVVDVKEEGLYGFTLVARNGVGLGKRPPCAGDQPQIWVEVDVTKPVVKLLDIQAGVSGESPHLNVCWKATDTNLSQRPITISYAEQAAGPWTVLASNIENAGAFLWQLHPGAPPRLLVRVEAIDLVGNVGVAQTPEPILLDLSQPSVSIVTVEPAGK
jgi:hypothetical protein